MKTVNKPISVESVVQIFASVNLAVNDTHLQNLIQGLQDGDISKVLEESLLPRNDPTSEVSPAVLTYGSETKKNSDEFDFNDLFGTASDSKDEIRLADPLIILDLFFLAISTQNFFFKD